MVTADLRAMAKQQMIQDGVLNVRKAAGWTSHDVVAKLRSLLKGPRIGHAGTLDPAATGVLPILVGKATRIAEYLLGWDKEYRAILRLGETTDTQDATGAVVARRSPAGVTEADIRSVVRRFYGRQRQVPPMYSAVKVGGVPLYKVARAGKQIEREPREVMIYAIEVLSVTGCDVLLQIVCSKGTYIRTLCADIGDALGVGGHLFSLERIRVGPLTIDRALGIEEIEAKLAAGRLAEDMLSLNQALQDLPALIVNETTAAQVRHGGPVPLYSLRGEGPTSLTDLRGRQVRLTDQRGRLLALGLMPGGEGGGKVTDSSHAVPGGSVTILKVFADAS